MKNLNRLQILSGWHTELNMDPDNSISSYTFRCQIILSILWTKKRGKEREKKEGKKRVGINNSWWHTIRDTTVTPILLPVSSIPRQKFLRFQIDPSVSSFVRCTLSHTIPDTSCLLGPTSVTFVLSPLNPLLFHPSSSTLIKVFPPVRSLRLLYCNEFDPKLPTSPRESFCPIPFLKGVCPLSFRFRTSEVSHLAQTPLMFIMS